MSRPPEMFDFPLSRKQVAEYYQRLAGQPPERIADAYRKAYEQCKMTGMTAPKARAIQELVVAWKVLWRWRRGGATFR